MGSIDQGASVALSADGNTAIVGGGSWWNLHIGATGAEWVFTRNSGRMPFANFMIANSAGAVAWALLYGLGAYYLGKGVEEFARPFAIALAVVGAIVVVSMILYWRRKEQELAAAAERDIPGPLQAEQSGEADR